MMESQESLKLFLKNRSGVLLLFGLSLIGGTLCAILLEHMNQIKWKEIEDYLAYCQGVNELGISSIVQVFFTYFKRFLMIWLLSGIAFLVPIAMGMIFLEVSVYSFALTSLYIYYGGAGIVIAGKLFLLQAILMIVLLLDLANYLFKRSRVFDQGKMNTYGYCLAKGLGGCLVVTVLEWGLTIFIIR